MRKDEPKKVEQFKDSFFGGKALLVLGGPSGKNWQSIKEDVKPDVVLGANGTCFEIDDLDFHLVVENLHMAAGMASRGVERYKRIMEIVSPNAHHAKVRMISFLNWEVVRIIDDRVDAIKIKRMGELGDDYEKQFSNFSFREYGDGFLAGPMFGRPGTLSNPRIKFRVGTVATQLLHLAGILGVSEIHTAGMDFCSYDHWYNYPSYQPDRFRADGMFVEYKGLQTQWDWIFGAKWLMETVKPIMEFEGILWKNHSNGLLEKIEEELQLM